MSCMLINAEEFDSRLYFLFLFMMSLIFIYFETERLESTGLTERSEASYRPAYVGFCEKHPLKIWQSHCLYKIFVQIYLQNQLAK